MVEVQRVGELGSGIDEVWALVRDFGGFVTALGAPVELEGPEGVGQLRSVPLGATPAVERLEERDDHAKRLVYALLSGPLPVEGYRATMQLEPAGDGRTRLTWSSMFEAAGTSEDEAATTVGRIYDGGIQALQGRFGA